MTWRSCRSQLANDNSRIILAGQGLKPLTRLRLKFPASVAVAGHHDLPELAAGRRAADLPSSVPAAVWVKLPATVSVLPAPTVRLPLLREVAGGGEAAPPVRLRLPLLEARPASR